MHPSLPPSQVFWSRLNRPQQDWLGNLIHKARQPIPSDWLKWFGDDILLGYISPDRAAQMLALLPHCKTQADDLVWQTPSTNPQHRSRFLQDFLEQQKIRGRLSGWRDELFCLWVPATCPPSVEASPWLCVERAGFRHLGMMSHAVHINGFLPNGDLWCGRRATSKSTDPGMLDNLAAGGLSASETPLHTALRELQEEANLVNMPPQHLVWVGAVRTQRPEPQGWHDEQLLVYNLWVSEAQQPVNTDGEVQGFLRLSPSEVVTRMQEGAFTPDACAALARGLGLPLTDVQLSSSS